MKNGQVKLIEQQVIKFRQEVGLGTSEAINLKSLLLKLKVLTMFRPLSENFSGMSLRDSSSHRFMLINSNQSRGRQHFTIAHELYHLFIEENPKPHKCISDDGVKNSIEKQADMFASILLMPEDGIIQLLTEEELANGTVTLASIIKLEHYYSVSRLALLNRLHYLALIKKTDKDSFAKLSAIQTAREYGYDTSLYNKGNEKLIIGNFGEKARTLFDTGKISEGHYIELLNKLGYNDED
ncbi:MAG: ImmA/IrrE family metallo-endopeptidase [Bacteroidales bacterium]